MSDEWSGFPKQTLEARGRAKMLSDALTAEEIARYERALQEVATLERKVDLTMELILDTRRDWAALIREEFKKYHEHEGGHPCGACGAIQAANWMDPDYTKDGPHE